MANFGWSLPPGVTTLPGEESIPKECEECNDLNEDGECPFYKREDFCPKLCTVSKCGSCGASVPPKVQGEWPKDLIVCGMHDLIFCCSTFCAETERKKMDDLARELSGQ